MSIARNSIAMAMSLVLAACGGGGSSSNGGATGGGGSDGGGGSTNPPTAACSLSSRQDFVKAVIDEWYLFPDLVNNSVNKSSFNNIDDYIDALVAPARAQSRDRFFSYMTSIAEENAFNNSGSTAGFGIRLSYDTANRRVFVIEAFENGPAFPQGLDRGVEIIAVGPNASSLQTTSSLIASGGAQAFSAALGPSDAGVQRVMTIREVGGTERQITVTKADFALDPISDRNGVRVLDDNGKKVGYINLRTFIEPAESDLRNAFEQFRQQGVTELIVDYRYNGGGLIKVAHLMGDLLAANRVNQVFSRETFRPSKAAEWNETLRFRSQAQAISATKIAFIGTGGTASASEMVANAMVPYLGNNLALVGSNTFGKPVGQFAFDRDQCDDRFRVVTLRTENANGQGDYYTGLAGNYPNTCRAADDIFTPLGDAREASIAQALAFLRDGASVCNRISSQNDGAIASAEQKRGLTGRREALMPAAPSPAQREVPGLF